MRVVVLDGNENQAVAATRSLARAGHRVVVGAPTRWSKAGWSRHARGTFQYPPAGADPTAFVSRVAEEAAREPGTLVLPMTERTTLPISAQRELILSAHGKLVLPLHETVCRAFDKHAMTTLAERLGIAVPKTRLLRSCEDADAAAMGLEFPVVLKPRASEEATEKGTRATGAPRYARNPAELNAGVRSLRARCNEILVQEFIPGTGAGYFALMRHGSLRAEFAHRRLRDIRPTGSGSALRTSIRPDPRARAAALAMLEDLRWHGVAMAEFRIRPDGTPVFLELNARFWNSLALAIHAGVDFPALLARLAESGDIPATMQFQEGVRCRWLLGDLRHLVEVWRGPPAGYPTAFPSRLGTLVRVLLPVRRTFHDNFEWTDPFPELGDWLDFLVHRVPRRGGRRD